MTTRPIDTQFQIKVSNMFSAYVRGYYSLASSIAEESVKELEQIPDKGWECHVLSIWRRFLLDWNVDSASMELEDVANQHKKKLTDPTATYKYYYTHLFKAIICSTEQTNLGALHEAANSATTCSKIFDAKIDSNTFADMVSLGRYDYYPAAWCTYWYRAQTRDVLGLGKEALEDYTRALKELGRDLLHNIERQRTPALPIVEGTEDLYHEVSRMGRAAWTVLITLCQDRAPFVARFLSDMGMFLFRKGDWGTAKLLLDSARQIDDQNPYVLSNYGFLLNYDRDEMGALPQLAKAFQLFEEQRKREESQGRIFEGSGRIYYQTGILAYKYQRAEVIAADRDERKRLEAFAEGARKRRKEAGKYSKDPTRDTRGHKIIGGINQEFARLFTEGKPQPCLKLFQKSAECYLKIKDITRALPAMILYCDPLDPKVMDTPSTQVHIRAARFLLWDLSQGMGPEFVGDLARFLNRVDQYLTREREYAVMKNGK